MATNKFLNSISKLASGFSNAVKNANQNTTTSSSSSTSSSTSSTPSSSTYKPSYGTDTSGSYKVNQDGSKVYMNDSNKKYFPTNYGGGAGWNYANTGGLGNTGSSVSSAPKTTNANGYNTNWNTSDYGKIANDYSYEGVKKQQATLNAMKGQDENLYKNDEYAHRMWQVANGQVNFGQNVSPYASTEFANTDKRYENDMSEAYMTANNFFNKVGSANINKYLNMDSQQLAREMNAMGLKAISPEQLLEVANPNLYHKTGVNVERLSTDYQDYLNSSKDTNVNGKNSIGQTILNNHNFNPNNGDVSLNDGLVYVNGQPMHWSNYVRYGEGSDAEKALYSNMLQNEKNSGNVEKIPLKARAELAPETMTPEMQQDLQTQLDLENQISRIDEFLSQTNNDVKKKSLNEVASSGNSGISNISDGTGGSSSYSGSATAPNLFGGTSSVSQSANDMSQYLALLSQGRGSQYGQGLGNLTAQQIAQLNAINNQLYRMQGVK